MSGSLGGRSLPPGPPYGAPSMGLAHFSNAAADKYKPLKRAESLLYAHLMRGSENLTIRWPVQSKLSNRAQTRETPSLMQDATRDARNVMIATRPGPATPTMYFGA